MGNCVVMIHVTGAHHNNADYDIDQMAATFADALAAKGHTVTAAALMVGGEYDLLNKATRFPLKPIVHDDDIGRGLG